MNLLVLSALSQTKQMPTQEIPEEYGYIVKIGQTVPEFKMELTDGSVINMSELRGKVVMLQFTASWCVVCRREMPHIEKDIWQKHKNNTNFALFGIDMGEPLAKVIQFKKDIKISYPLALDPDATIFYTFAAKGTGVTRNIIVDKDGTIIYMTRLFKQDEFEDMKQVIDKLLKNT
jgi:peroxiredoxin